MSRLYYTEPSQDIFDEVKSVAIEIWREYDNTYGYADEKVDEIKDMENIKDNLMYIVAMFDQDNQQKLADKLSDESRKAIRDRMIDGGNEEWLICF